MHPLPLERLVHPGPPAGVRRLATCLLVLLVGVIAPVVSNGDDDVPRPMPVREADAVEPADIADVPGNVVYLRDETGRLVPVPRDVRLEQYLEWLRRDPEATTSRFSVVRVSLVGSADDKVATLTATIQVKVSGDDWVRVPLALEEAVLRDFDYRFLDPPPRAAKAETDAAETDVETDAGTTPDEPRGDEPHTDEAGGDETARVVEPDANFEGFEAETGYVWRMRGRGTHELVLELLVPVRLQSPTRRLQLDLPETAVSRLELEVPGSPISVAPPRGSQWNTSEVPGNRSRIEVFGLGRRLDLTWEPRPRTRRADTSLQAITLVDVRPNDRTIVLEATQRVQVVRGTIGTLRMKLPSAFEVRDVTARMLDELGSETVRLELPPANDGWSEVALPQPLGERGRVELEWTLESAASWSDGPVRVDGFAVDLAASQSGELAIDGLTGHDVTVRSARNVHRIDVTELGRATPAISAYRFLRQPFDVRLDIREIDPHYSVQPRFDLHVSRDSVQLDGELLVRVYRGALRELTLTWPDFAEEGWTLSPPNVAGLVERFEVVGSGTDSQLRFQLLEAATGEVRLPIRARRSLKQGDRVSLSLPTMAAPYRLPTTLQVTRTIDVAPALAARDTTSARHDSKPVRPLPEDRYFVEALRIDPGPHRFELDVVARERTVAVEALVRTEFVDGDLRVRQRLDYDVAYGYLEEFELVTAGDLPVVVLDDGTTLEVQWATPDLGETRGSRGDAPERIVRVLLDRARTGRFSVSIVHGLGRVTAPSDVESEEIDVELVWPADVDTWAATFVSKVELGFAVRPVGAAWESLGGTATRRWRAERPGPRTRLVLERERNGLRIVVRKALVRTVIDGTGTANSRARFEIDRVDAPIVVVLPESCTVDEFQWNGRSLDRTAVVVSASDPRRFALDVGSGAELGGLLLVRYHAVGTTLRTLLPTALEAPRLPTATWVEQTVWQVALPSDRYLLVPPENCSPNYEWQRAPFFWKRVPRPAYADPVAWMDDVESDDERAEFDTRHGYQFTRFGSVERIEFRTASRGYVVLFGAGVALALGFVLLKVPTIRGTLAILGVAFALAVLSIWFPEPVLLLLQPALLGLLLALAAAFIDGLVVRRQSSPILSFPTPLDFSSFDSNAADGSTKSQQLPPPDPSEDTGLYVQSAAAGEAGP